LSIVDAASLAMPDGWPFHRKTVIVMELPASRRHLSTDARMTFCAASNQSFAHQGLRLSLALRAATETVTAGIEACRQALFSLVRP
jgi:hypothetical protein